MSETGDWGARDLQTATVAIVGVGLMGASAAAGLRDKVVSLHGIDPDPAAREAARPFFDTLSDSIQSASQADVILLAAPIRAILAHIAALGQIARPGALILDMGSTKRAVVAAMNALPETLRAIGGHPMCGKERSGAEAAEASLYRECRFVLCPTARTTPQAMNTALAIAAALGAHPVTLDAETHDRAVSMISHLPYMASVIMVRAVGAACSPDNMAWNLTAGGWRDTSRIAASSIAMWSDILLTNREHALDMLARLSDQLTRLRLALYDSDETTLRAILESARAIRNGWAEGRYGRPDQGD